MLFRRSSTVIAWPPGPLTPARLNQCLALAVLLHVLLIAVIGNTPGGTARVGEGVWGAVNSALRVTLTGPRGTEPEAAPPRPPEINVGAVGMAPQQRYGGAVRREPAPPSDTPGAARLGNFSTRPSDGESEPIDRPPTRSKFLPITRPDEFKLKSAPALTSVEPLPELPPLRAAPPVPAPVPTPTPAPVEAPTSPMVAPMPTPTPTPTPQPTPAPAPAPAPPAAAEPAPAPPADPVPAAAPAAAPVERAPIAASPTPATSLYGTPDAGQRLGHDVATAPSTPASAPRPKLDLSLPRGGLVSSRGSRGMLELMPHPPERQNKVEKAVDAAAKADCRKAYGDELGLLAAVPLAIDALRDKGCKW